MSLYLNRLSKDERASLTQQLWLQQSGKCFISGKPIELALHETDIDHIIPTRDNGKDDPSNFALTLSHYNRSKQASDLRIARVLARFDDIKAQADSDDRGANLNDVLRSVGGSSAPLRLTFEGNTVSYIAPGTTEPVRLPVHEDGLSGMRYFFAVLPVECVYHDDRINPRPIGNNLRGLIEEFHRRRPQLHVALGWVETANLPKAEVRVFDGQHKAAAQILLGIRNIPLRIFVDPDLDQLLTANTNAGTTLRQVAFDKSVQRRLGNRMLLDRITRYRAEKGLPEDFEEFSERTLVDHFKGEQAVLKRYILDSVRDGITHDPNNRLMDFVEYAGKGYEKPLSYSAIEKTFYSQFIYSGLLETAWNHRAELGENPRELERTQIVRLMNLIATKIYVGKYDEDRGTRRLESAVQSGDDMPEPHLRAFRMAKEEILQCWLSYIRRIAEQHFLIMGRAITAERLFQYPFPEQLWINIGNFIDNLARLPLWVNRDASSTVFGAKQTYKVWQSIFEDGTTPAGQKVMVGGLNIMEMIKG